MDFPDIIRATDIILRYKYLLYVNCWNNCCPYAVIGQRRHGPWLVRFIIIFCTESRPFSIKDSIATIVRAQPYTLLFVREIKMPPIRERKRANRTHTNSTVYYSCNETFTLSSALSKTLESRPMSSGRGRQLRTHHCALNADKHFMTL